MADGLNAPTDPRLGALTESQTRAVLIVGLSCSCISLVATLITLRWFLLMKRLFRHRLVLYLVLSDFFKALWYFIFPIVVFTRGPVQTSSAWCQTQGFLLSVAIEASDFAILLIAFHAMLYIFRPQERIGKGGLYKYRRWTPLIWLGPPLLFSSLAFLNHGQGYITAGTFCYIPKRPIWYRLALSYIPRYLIISTIFIMYTAISIYVHIKFRSFKQVVAPHGDTSDFGSELEDTTSDSESIAPDETVSESDAPAPRPPSPEPLSTPVSEKKLSASRPAFTRGFSHRSQNSASQNTEPWDSMRFITSIQLQDQYLSQAGIQVADFAPELRGSASSDATQVNATTPSVQLNSFKFETNPQRQLSAAPSHHSSHSTEKKTFGRRGPKNLVVKDPLQRTRIAIKNQLRFLFIYPAVYALMWLFPFAQNCTVYSDHFAAHPIFWLQILSTCALSLQAAVDCLVFSWREKPWRRLDENSRFSIPFWKKRSLTLIKRLSYHGSPRPSTVEQSRHATTTSDHVAPDQPVPSSHPPSRNWWEEEGKKRKDSVWMGTDLISRWKTQHSADADRIGTIAEGEDSV